MTNFNELLMGIAIGLIAGFVGGIMLGVGMANATTSAEESNLRGQYSCAMTDKDCIRSHIEVPRFGPAVDYNGEPIGLFDRKLGKVYFFDETKSSASSRLSP